MLKHYNSDLYLFYSVCNSIFGLVIFYFVLDAGFTSEALVTTVLSLLAAACRLAALAVQWSIWLRKPTCVQTLCKQDTEPFLGWLQALFPVLVSISVTLRLWTMMLQGPCFGSNLDPIHPVCNVYTENCGIFMILLMELVFNPVLTFTLVPDTSMVAIWISWTINLVNLLGYAVVLRSPDVIGAAVSYTSSSILLYCDTQSHNRATTELIEQLQATLAANEILAVEAQAIELRAMIGNIAHDLKTPLTSFLSGVECISEVVASWEALLVSNSQVALSKALGNLATIKTCLHSMHGTNSFMTMTINRCLDYTKASQGFKLVPKQETVSLSSMVELPLRMMRDAQSTIEIRVEPWDQQICTHIITDKQWLLENLLCLLSNAVKYSNAGNVHLGISLIPNPCAGNLDTTDEGVITHHLRFDLQDTGIGLSDEAMANLFAPFQQAQRMAGGTGLGLFSLARRVEALRGLYGVSKRPDSAKGSLFWFTIPYRPDEMSAAESKPRRPDSCNSATGFDWAPSPIYSLSTVPHNRLQVDCNSPDITLHPDHVTAPQTQTSFQILVVDDAPLIVRMTTMLLKRKGHIVEQAVNGAEALDRIVAAYAEDGTKPSDDCGTPAFDVVVMDLQMPVMDGIEAIRRVRAAEQVHNLRYESIGRQQQVVAAGGGIAFSPTSAADVDTGQQEKQGDRGGGGAEEGGSAITTNEEEGPAESAAGGPLPPKPPIKATESSSALAPGSGQVNFTAAAASTATVQYKEQTEVKEEEEEEEACRNKSSLMRQRYHQFIIAVSANSDHETVQVALAAGADAFISKPFAYDSFQQAIEHRMK